MFLKKNKINVDGFLSPKAVSADVADSFGS
jgi:hypothetical protein